MRRNQGKNGLTIDQNIELTEARPYSTSILIYILQAVMVVFLCQAIIHCFLSGMDIKINVAGLNLRIIAYVAMFFLVFIYKPYIKFTLPALLLVFILIVFSGWESVEVGFYKTSNAIIQQYNYYFGKSVECFTYSMYADIGYSNSFIYDVSFLLVGVLCYVILYSKNITTYLVVTVPFVFSPFIVGLIPSAIPYICYIAGTVGVFGMLIGEKHNKKYMKGHKRLHTEPYIQISKSKLAIQYISVAVVLFLTSLVYTFYSPERYQEEFKAKEIRVAAKEKFNELMSGDLLKDTVFGQWFKSTAASGGLNKGILNNAGEIKFKHETALKVTTVRSENPGECYLKGFIGEQYQSNQWVSSNKEDQAKLKEIENTFTVVHNAESISGCMADLIINSPYYINEYNVKPLQVENVKADTSVSYIPYNAEGNVENENGRLSTGSNSYTYMDFLAGDSEGSPLSESYRNIDAMNVLKLNLINSAIYEQYYKVTMNSNWVQQMEYDKMNSLSEKLFSVKNGDRGELQQNLTIDTSKVSSEAIDSYDSLPLFLNKNMYVLDLGNTIAQINTYGKEENAYFNYAREVYTKLPETGLERVKSLVAGHEVNINPTVLNGENYSNLQQLGGIKSVEDSYNQMFFGVEVQVDSDDTQIFSFEGRPIREDDASIQAKYYEAIEYVRNYLAQNTSYTLKPGKAPSGQDFVDYFLFNNKKGFCVHYATAATVMLRAMGVPARYVEGYVITGEDYQKGTVINQEMFSGAVEANGYGIYSSDLVEMNIEDTNAHAWVEVYLPGLGWQPIEMTAPYIYDSNIEIPPVNNDPQATLKPTPTPSATITPSMKPTTTPKATPKTTPKVSQRPINKSSDQLGFIDGLKNWYEKLGDTAQLLIKLGFGLILLLLIALISLYSRYYIKKSLRKSRKKVLSHNEWVLEENRRLDNLLRHFKLVYRSINSHEEFVAALKKEFDYLDEQQAQLYYEIILKARFDKGQITDMEVNACQQFYEHYITGLLQSVGKVKRWLYKILWTL